MVEKIWVPPRLELGSLDSKSKVLTITPRNLYVIPGPICAISKPVIMTI